MNRHHEDLIRERAYQIWEDEGRPDGASERHWQQAVAAVTEALAPQAGENGRHDGKGSPAQEALAELSAAQPDAISPKRRRKAG